MTRSDCFGDGIIVVVEWATIAVAGIMVLNLVELFTQPHAYWCFSSVPYNITSFLGQISWAARCAGH